MAYQSCFKRFELKYMLTQPQKEALLQVMQPYMKLDQYGRTTIRNIYYDTPNYRLIRRSIERPLYKEKLRVRSYRQAAPDGDVFVELKKKFKKVVYKRRLAMPLSEATDWLCGNDSLKPPGQIGRRSTISVIFTESCSLQSSCPMNGKPSTVWTAVISV